MELVGKVPVSPVPRADKLFPSVLRHTALKNSVPLPAWRFNPADCGVNLNMKPLRQISRNNGTGSEP